MVDTQSPVATIVTDRTCIGCEYNLRGLPISGRCPECGLPVGVKQEIDDPLSLMPPHVIRAFRRGCWLASSCVMICLAVLLVGRWTNWSPWVPLAQLGAVAVVWIVAVCMLTPCFELPQAQVRGFSSRGRLRTFARWLQLGWIVAIAAAVLDLALPAGTFGKAALSPGLVGIGIMIGLAGVVTLAVLLERLAEWTRDGEAEVAFNWASWGLPIVTPLAFVQMPLAVVDFFVHLIWLVVVCTFPYALLSLSRSVTLSGMHAREFQDRLRRRRARDEAYGDEVAARLARLDESQESSERR